MELYTLNQISKELGNDLQFFFRLTANSPESHMPLGIALGVWLFPSIDLWPYVSDPNLYFHSAVTCIEESFKEVIWRKYIQVIALWALESVSGSQNCMLERT